MASKRIAHQFLFLDIDIIDYSWSFPVSWCCKKCSLSAVPFFWRLGMPGSESYQAGIYKAVPILALQAWISHHEWSIWSMFPQKHRHIQVFFKKITSYWNKKYQVPVKLCRPTSGCSTWDKLAVENQHSFTNVNPSRNSVVLGRITPTVMKS